MIGYEERGGGMEWGELLKHGGKRALFCLGAQIPPFCG